MRRAALIERQARTTRGEYDHRQFPFTEAVMSVVRVEVDEVIQRPVDQIFARLVDLSSYADWMPRTGVFKSCAQASDGPIGLGTIFIDRGRMGTWAGSVVEFRRPTRVVFKESLRWFGTPVLDALICYDLSPLPEGTALHHVGESELHGVFKLMRPMVVLIGRRERRNTVRALKRSLEAPVTEMRTAAA
jgi:uncharacterized protein YndB with AHSA1/START domain